MPNGLFSKLRIIAEAVASGLFMLFLLIVGPFWLKVHRYLVSRNGVLAA
jgi:hypothetical protein